MLVEILDIANLLKHNDEYISNPANGILLKKIHDDKLNSLDKVWSCSERLYVFHK